MSPANSKKIEITTQPNLSEKVIVVTGGSKGIGKALVQNALRSGAKVACCSRQTDALHSLAIESNTLGFSEQLLPIQADISKEEEVEQLFEDTLLKFGKIDIIINNAAITRDFLLLAMPKEEWLDVIATNLTGTFLVSKKAIKVFLQQNSPGNILTVGSIAQNGSPSAAAYATSKGGLLGLTQAIAHEFAHKNISANLIAFGLVETELTAKYPSSALEAIKELCPLKRAASTTEAANILLYFSCLPSKLFNGQSITISGGFNEIPALFFSSKYKATLSGQPA